MVLHACMLAHWRPSSPARASPLAQSPSSGRPADEAVCDTTDYDQAKSAAEAPTVVATTTPPTRAITTITATATTALASAPLGKLGTSVVVLTSAAEAAGSQGGASEGVGQAGTEECVDEASAQAVRIEGRPAKGDGGSTSENLAQTAVVTDTAGADGLHLGRDPAPSESKGTTTQRIPNGSLLKAEEEGGLVVWERHGKSKSTGQKRRNRVSTRVTRCTLPARRSRETGRAGSWAALSSVAQKKREGLSAQRALWKGRARSWALLRASLRGAGYHMK